MEKSLSTAKKESSELRSGLLASQRKEKVLERELKETKATLKLEKETAEMTIEGYKEGFANVKKENEMLLEQMEDIVVESMLKNRYDLMKEYVEGKNVDWKPEKWIRAYERRSAGIQSSSEEEEEETRAEVDIEREEAAPDPLNVEALKEVEQGKEEEEIIGQVADQPEAMIVEFEGDVVVATDTTTGAERDNP